MAPFNGLQMFNVQRSDQFSARERRPALATDETQENATEESIFEARTLLTLVNLFAAGRELARRQNEPMGLRHLADVTTVSLAVILSKEKGIPVEEAAAHLRKLFDAGDPPIGSVIQ